MMMFDHGMPRADGTLSPEQRPEADVNIEFAGASKFAEGAMKLAWFFQTANEKYATDYPARVGQHMTNTDSDPFKDLDSGDQPSRERARRADRRRLGSELASADGRVHHVQRQGFPTRPERGADDAQRDRAAHRGDGQEVVRRHRARCQRSDRGICSSVKCEPRD